MDPEEIRDYSTNRRQELSHLVDPRHQETPSRGLAELAARACVEVVS